MSRLLFRNSEPKRAIDVAELHRAVPLARVISHSLDAEFRRVSRLPQRSSGSSELVAEIEHLALRDAAIFIADHFGVQLQNRARGVSHHQKGHHMSGKPSYKVFVVEDRPGGGEDNDAFWTRIGSAWPNKDGKGFNIVLSALPTNGRLVLREYSSEDEKKDADRAKARKK